MNEIEYDILKNTDALPHEVIKGSDLQNQKDRSLIYGYDCERNTFHVYLKDGKIHFVLYGYSLEPELLNYQSEDSIEDNKEYVPNKRIYPFCSDAEFCMMLKKRGVYLSFTTYLEREEQDFYGYVYEYLING
jgi:hypothetical protein